MVLLNLKLESSVGSLSKGKCIKDPLCFVLESMTKNNAGDEQNMLTLSLIGFGCGLGVPHFVGQSREPRETYRKASMWEIIRIKVYITVVIGALL